jgi:filamentous hemagglutinin family protein
MAPQGRLLLGFVAVCSVAAAGPRAASAQHITVDGRFSPVQTLAGPNYAIGANLGKQVGSNLFHSFGQFGLSTGESATFSGSGTVSNVIGRVTGGNPSAIDGKIQSNIAGAKLFLINPSGVVFGPNATVNVSGSFHASTADYVRMSDGARFQATNPDASTLSAAPPAAFGFLMARPAALTVNGSTLAPVPGTLGLVGGPVTISNRATLSAPAGTIHVTSAAATGEVAIDPRNTAATTVTSFGPVDITTGSLLSVSNRTNLGTGGSVFIRSGALTVDASQINADNFGLSRGGQLTIQVDGDIVLSNGATASATSFGGGSGASVIVSSQGSLTLSDPGTGIIASAAPTASGNAGSVSVAAPQITIRRGAEIISTTAGTGAAGSVTVITPGTLVLDGAGTHTPTQIATSATEFLSGPNGMVTVRAGTLTVEGGAQIASSTAGPGRGGDVDITVASDIVLPDPGPQVTALSTGNGDAGSIILSAARLLMNNRAAISTEASGLPRAAASGGNITLHVLDFLHLVSSEISTQVVGEVGNGANIVIDDPLLVILDHSSIIANAITGHGGNITITADQFIPSSDSIVAASSQSGISGIIPVNGVVQPLSTELRRPATVVLEACAGRGSSPRSSLVGAGPIGVPQDFDAPLASLYLGGRDRATGSGMVFGAPPATGPSHAALDLKIACE